MDANAKKKPQVLESEEGQALIEFILFFPFLLMMYAATLSIGNAINSSINQQKATRGYFYYIMQNNSTAPYPKAGDRAGSYTRFGAELNLWGERLVGDEPVAACFKFNIMLGQRDGDECESGYEDRTTQFIRVGTVYGICGATYVNSNGNITRLPNVSGSAVNPSEVVASNSCLYQ